MTGNLIAEILLVAMAAVCLWMSVCKGAVIANQQIRIGNLLGKMADQERLVLYWGKTANELAEDKKQLENILIANKIPLPFMLSRYAPQENDAMNAYPTGILKPSRELHQGIL